MDIDAQFLAPRFTATNLDRFLVRSAILNALKETLPRFSGTLLDIGCGYMPYKDLVLSLPSQAENYIGLDLRDNVYQKPDLEWDGNTIPLSNESVDCVVATEVFEHCPEPKLILSEIIRVLKPGGLLFFTVPFLWPLHEVPHDEYRYTPFSLERHLRTVGFEQIKLNALGGWDACLAQMLGLWIRRRPMIAPVRSLLSLLVLPLFWLLAQRDSPPKEFRESTMLTGISGTAIKPIL